jgi:hypothetical protein
MLEHLSPDDRQKDTDLQKVRRQTERPINTADDKEFSQDEIRQVLEGFKDKKAPRPNGVTNELVKKYFKLHEKQ